MFGFLKKSGAELKSGQKKFSTHDPELKDSAVKNECAQNHNIDVKDIYTRKIAFIAKLGHELRGALGIIQNSAELLGDSAEEQNGGLSEEQTEMVQMIKGNCVSLLDLIDDVLDFAKIEIGKLPVNIAKISCRETLSEIVKIVRIQSENLQSHIQYKEPKEDYILLADKRIFRKIILNSCMALLEQFQEGSLIEIGISTIHNSSNTTKKEDFFYSIVVKGLGIYLDPSTQHHTGILTLERLKSDECCSTHTKTELFGFSLIKSLTEISGGTFVIRVENNIGTTFEFRFKSIKD
jgi:signal transduction histidine kinase